MWLWPTNELRYSCTVWCSCLDTNSEYSSMMLLMQCNVYSKQNYPSCMHKNILQHTIKINNPRINFHLTLTCYRIMYSILIQWHYSHATLHRYIMIHFVVLWEQWLNYSLSRSKVIVFSLPGHVICVLQSRFTVYNCSDYFRLHSESFVFCFNGADHVLRVGNLMIVY